MVTPPSSYYHYHHPLPLPPPFPSPFPYMHNIFNSDDNNLIKHKNNYDFNSKIMLTAIISLSFAVLLVIALHLYARFVLRRRPAHNRAILTTLGLTIATDNHTGEPPKTGLDPSVIASLPIFVYKQSCHGSKEDDDCNDGSFIECAVCLSFLEDQELARTLPNCKHTFHAECIDKWLSSHSNCPICRTEAEPRIQPLQREGPSGGGAATAPPPLEQVNCTLDIQAGTSSERGGNRLSPKQAAGGGGSSISRLSSFRRILSRERSSTGLQSDHVQEQGFEDIERQ